MKKLLTLFVCAVGFVAHSQKLVVTPDGLRAEADATKDYVVVDVPGKTAAEQYKNLYNYIQMSYKNPDAVIKGKVEGEYLSFETYKPDAVLGKAGMSKSTFNAKYTTRVDFKDGKARITFSDIDWTMPPGKGNYKILWKGGAFDGYIIYNKKGELKEEGNKLQVEELFNKQIDTVKSALNGTAAAKKEEW